MPYSTNLYCQKNSQSSDKYRTTCIELSTKQEKHRTSMPFCELKMHLSLKNTQTEVEKYTKSIITCSKPDQTSSLTLHALVSQFQTHKCNRYCLKSYKSKNKFFKKCPFGFPRPVQSNFTLNDVIDYFAINKRKQPRKRLYHLPRTEAETKINDYNAALLLANQANVNVQYTGHLGSRLPYYITDYIASIKDQNKTHCGKTYLLHQNLSARMQSLLSCSQ